MGGERGAVAMRWQGRPPCPRDALQRIAPHAYDVRMMMKVELTLRKGKQLTVGGDLEDC